MPENKVSDPITGQEIAFALLVLSGAMTDRQAAEAVGLHPDSAAYTKAKPSVRAYMLEHPAAVRQPLVQQDADLSRLPRQAVGRAVEQLRRLSPDREQVLARLWELAHLSPEMTRGSITGQVKAISMIVAMQNFIPDRRALSSEKKSAPAPVNAQIYEAEWLRKQRAARPCLCPARRWACSRLGGRGASGPWPQPVHRRKPLYSFGSPHTLCPPVRSGHQSSSLYKKEPLRSPPLSC